MAETFCGKSCENCQEKHMLGCEGCKKPWGKPANEDCEIAVCCYGKGHEACETCSFCNGCGKLREREDMAYYRRRKRETEEKRAAEWRETITERAGLMGKWGTALFWIVIAGELSGLFGSGMLATSLTVIISVAYGAALLQLTPLTQRYRTAGLCAIAVSMVYLVVGVIPAGSGDLWTVLIGLPGSIVALVRDYYEFHAHAEVLDGVEDTLAAKWRKLWQWSIRMLAALLGAVVVVLIVPTVGGLIILAAAVGALVIEVFKIIYLYRTSKLFRELKIEC